MIPAIVLLIVNVLLALGLGVPLARRLARKTSAQHRLTPWLFTLLAIYFAECIAFSASMATNILGFCLAFAWGALFARKLQPRDTFLLALYSCAPALSFLSLLFILARAGWPLLSPDGEAGGRRFGIPTFIPWPFNTLLGFVLTIALSALLFKTIITTLTASLLRPNSTATKPS